jgi:hypothetical protein
MVLNAIVHFVYNLFENASYLEHATARKNSSVFSRRS